MAPYLCTISSGVTRLLQSGCFILTRENVCHVASRQEDFAKEQREFWYGVEFIQQGRKEKVYEDGMILMAEEVHHW